MTRILTASPFAFVLAWLFVSPIDLAFEPSPLGAVMRRSLRPADLGVVPLHATLQQ